LRWLPPIHSTFRFARSDALVQDTAVAAGTPILVIIGSANRDPRVFNKPEAWDPGRWARGEARPISFGAGEHICIGSNLAQAELSAALNALLDHLPRLTLTSTSLAFRGRSVRQLRELVLTVAK